MRPRRTGKYIFRFRTSTRRSVSCSAEVGVGAVSIAISAPCRGGAGVNIHPAGDVVIVAHGLERWVLLVALLHRVNAARLKRALGADRDEIGRESFDRHELGLALHVHARDGLQQSKRIGMARVSE